MTKGSSSLHEFKSREELATSLVDFVLAAGEDHATTRQLLIQLIQRHFSDDLLKSTTSAYKSVFDIETTTASALTVQLDKSKCVQWLRQKVQCIEAYLAQLPQEPHAKKKTDSESDTAKRAHAFELVAQ